MKKMLFVWNYFSTMKKIAIFFLLIKIAAFIYLLNTKKQKFAILKILRYENRIYVIKFKLLPPGGL